MAPVPSLARRLRDRGVRTRIVGVVVAAVLVAVAAGLLGVAAIASATDRTRAMYEQHTVGVQLALEARYQYSTYRFASLNRASAPTPDIADQYQAQRDDAQAALLAALEGLRARAVAGGTVLAVVAQVQDDVTSYVELTAQLEQLAADGRIVEFNQLRESEVGPLSGRLLDALDGLATAVQEEARARRGRRRRGRAAHADVDPRPGGCGRPPRPCWAAPSSRTGSAGTSPACGGRRSAWPTATSPLAPDCGWATTSAGRRPRSTRRRPPSARW